MSNTGRHNGCDELLFPLDWIMIWYIVSSIAMALVGGLIYVYYLRKGQFDDPEDVKYQMFREEDEN